MRQTAFLVTNPITVDSYALLFNCNDALLVKLSQAGLTGPVAPFEERPLREWEVACSAFDWPPSEFCSEVPASAMSMQTGLYKYNEELE